MNIFHILNGDCLAKKFPKKLEEEVIIWREALIDGPISDINFFENREKFIRENYDSERSYEELVLKEFHKIQSIPKNAEIYFWFEDDLFCQVNFWFLISNLSYKKIKLFRIFPKDSEKGFAESGEPELLEIYDSAKEINDFEINLITNLWKGFQQNDLRESESSEIVRNLQNLVLANANRFNGILENQIKDIQKRTKSFDDFFRIFIKEFPIYGFGDLQLINILKN